MHDVYIEIENLYVKMNIAEDIYILLLCFYAKQPNVLFAGGLDDMYYLVNMQDRGKNHVTIPSTFNGALLPITRCTCFFIVEEDFVKNTQ